MTLPLTAIFEAIDATWPAARRWEAGGFLCRDGQGGGKRASAATRLAPDCDIQAAEQAMRSVGQPPLFMLRPGETDLDAALEARGYATIDPTNIYVAPVSQLTDRPIPRVTAFAIWEPLAIMNEVWVKGGIGPERQAVMNRVQGPKTGILARWNEKPAGAAFAAVHHEVCMVHAVEVLPYQRRQGVAGWIMRRAAFWAADHGAETIAVLCTEANVGANKLYRALGFQRTGGYSYRIKRETT